MEKLPSRLPQRPAPQEKIEEMTPAERARQLRHEIDEIAAPNILGDAFHEKALLDPEVFTLNNMECRFYGVAHTKETFANYREIMREAIRESDLVILEGSPEIQVGSQPMENYLSDKTGSIVALVDGASEKVKRERFFAQLNGEWEEFYHGASDIAALEGKTVVLMDPANLIGASAEERREYVKKWRETLPAQMMKTTAALGVGGLAAAAGAALVSKNPTTSRRGFLRELGAAAMGAGAVAAASHLSQTDLDDEHGNILAMSDTRRRAEEAVTVSMYDMRNIFIAGKLESLSKKLPQGTKAALFFGDGHRKAIQDYLHQPEWREIKRRMYEVIGPLPPNVALGAWRFDFASGTWKISEHMSDMVRQQR